MRLAAGSLALAAGIAALAGGAAASPARQQAPGGTGAAAVAPVDVVEVNGWIDEVLVDAIERAIVRAGRDGSQALVLQLDSPGAVVGAERMARLAERLATSPVAVGIWVGPSSSVALGEAGQLLAAVPVSAMAPNTRLGALGPPLPVDPASGIDLSFGEAGPALRNGTLREDEARDRGALKLRGGDQGAPVLNNFVAMMDGLEWQGRTLVTAVEVPTADGGTRIETPTTRLFKLELLPRLMHTVASPPVAYLLLIVGLFLLMFEFFTAGVGIAGVVGAVSLVLAAYGLAALPTRWWALVLVALAVVAYAVDVQTGVPRFWTAAGTVMFVIGSVWLFDGIALSWITLLVGIGGALLTVLAGMPSMVRTRFATPTIGREWMVGEVGEAVEAVAPDGTVRVRGALWRARTNRATPIAAGGAVRVVAIDGVVLEVEPPEGGARDYREGRGSR